MVFNFNTLEQPFVTVDQSGSFQFNNSIGIMLPFNPEDGGVFNKSFFSEDQARTNLMNLLSTRKGERLYHINFGTELYKVLFEQITDSGEIESFIRTEIITAMGEWTPYLTVTGIDITTPANIGSADSPYSIKVNLRTLFNPTQANINLLIFINNQGSITVE